MNDVFKNNVVKLVVGGIAIFVLGIFIGYQLDSKAISSIQGFLFNAAGWATDTNATDTNATDANATDANATDANATSSNVTYPIATGSNVTDNIIYLQQFRFRTNATFAGSLVDLDMVTSGAYLYGATITLMNQSNNYTFSVNVKSICTNPYIELPINLSSATYTVTDILLTGLNSDQTTFSKHYSNDSGDNNWEFGASMSISGNATNIPIKLDNFSLNTKEVSVGERVGVKYHVNEPVDLMRLDFQSNTGETIMLFVQSLNDEAYIEIPTTTVSGTYELFSVTVTTANHIKSFTLDGLHNTEKYDLNTLLNIKDGTEPSFIYNNEDINSKIISKLYDSKTGTEITVNANSNTIISEELFNVIKGQDKSLIINYGDNQIIFKGKDIKNPKAIDVKMVVGPVASNQSIEKLVSDGIVVNFPDNGNLPGTALVKVKATSEVIKTLGDKIYVYFYNESTNDFCLIAEEVKKTNDGYYEFTISHNSDYLLVNEKLAEKLVVSQNSDHIVSFQKDDKTYLLLIGAGVVVLIAIICIVISAKKKK